MLWLTHVNTLKKINIQFRDINVSVFNENFLLQQHTQNHLISHLPDLPALASFQGNLWRWLFLHTEVCYCNICTIIFFIYPHKTTSYKTFFGFHNLLHCYYQTSERFTKATQSDWPVADVSAARRHLSRHAAAHRSRQQNSSAGGDALAAWKHRQRTVTTTQTAMLKLVSVNTLQTRHHHFSSTTDFITRLIIDHANVFSWWIFMFFNSFCSSCFTVKWLRSLWTSKYCNQRV